MRWFITGPLLRLLPVGLVALAIQRTVLSDATFRGVVIPLVLALAASTGAGAGSELGALGGFTLGVMYDLATGTPLGLTALVYGMAAFVAGYVFTITPSPPWWLSSLSAAFAAALGEFAQPVARSLVGIDGWFDGRLWTVVPVTFVFTLLTAPILVPVGRWSMGAKRFRWKVIPEAT